MKHIWPDIPPSGFKVCGTCGGHGCPKCIIRRGVGVVKIVPPVPTKKPSLDFWKSLGTPK